MKSFFFQLGILALLGCSHTGINNSDRIPASSADKAGPPSLPPGLPGGCIQPGTMPVTPDTCQVIPKMCGCDKFPHDPTVKPNRLRIPSDKLLPFPSVAPGIKSYSDLGYCTGVSTGPRFSGSTLSSERVEDLGVRSYSLRFRQAVDLIAKKNFVKLTMDDQPDEKTDKMRPCAPLGQVEKTVLLKNRPTNAPPLFFVEGETAEIIIYNDTPKTMSAKDIVTTVHWHGLILPNDQDGVPDITQAPIRPGEKKVYRFKVLQSGTYWYHPHDLNEQDTKGAFIIFPNPAEEEKSKKEFGGVGVRYHHDRTLILTDYKKRDTLKQLNYLRDEDRNTYEIDSRIHKGWLNNLNCSKEYIENFKMMRMFLMDKADVWYDSFFVNDETCLNCGMKPEKVEMLHSEYPKQKFARLKEFNNFKAGERVRLRLINTSASTYFFLDYANADTLNPNQKLDMLIVAKDGLPIKPQYADQLYIGTGEAYDVLVEIPENGVLYELRAKSIDDNNDARMARALMGSNPIAEKETTKIVSARNVAVKNCGPYPEMKDQLKEVSYSQMEILPSRIPSPTNEVHPFEVYHVEAPISKYHLELSGSMENYQWRIDGVKGTKLGNDSMKMPFLKIKEGHRIRVTINNDMIMGMMNHPWHLHGNWFRIIDEKDTDAQIAKKALFHTATIFPGQKMTLEFFADPAYRGAWMFHCHNLYHMENDMMMYLIYDTLDENYVHRMNHSTGAHHEMKKPSIFPGMKNQYGVAGVSGEVGTEGAGGSLDLRYRGTLGNNLGLFDFDFNVASTKAEDLQNFKIESKAKYCYAVNKCVFLDFDLHHPSEGMNEYSGYAGGEYQPWNSELLVLEGGLGSVCTENLTTKEIKCGPGIKTEASSTIDAGFYTKVTGRVGCEGEYCSEFFAGLKLSITPHPRITIIPINCKISTSKDQTACFAEIKIMTDPIPLGR